MLTALSSCRNSYMNAQNKEGKTTEEFYTDRNELVFEEKLHQEYDVNQKELKIYNLNGDIHVSQHEGDKIILDITKIIKSKTKEKLETGKNALKLGVDQQQGLTLFIEAPVDTRPKNGDTNYKCDHWKYSFNVDYYIKVPKNFNGIIQSVNGDIIVNSNTLSLEANTVNGDLKIEQAKLVGDSKTVNGDVEIMTTGFLYDAIDIATINGDIKVSLPEGADAEISFESLNGEFYTDFENAEILNKVKKSVIDGNGDKSYKLNKIDGIKLGMGKSKINCKNINGDIFIKKI